MGRTFLIVSIRISLFVKSVMELFLKSIFPTHRPVQNPAEDVLWVEVWDFDPAETVREKITKIGEVKGVRGLRKLLKEIAITASTGKHDNELVGSTNIPLRVSNLNKLTMS